MGPIGGNALARPVAIRSVGDAPLTNGATSGTRGERGPGADVALAKTFAIGELLESRDTSCRRSSIHPRDLAMATSRASRVSGVMAGFAAGPCTTPFPAAKLGANQGRR